MSPHTPRIVGCVLSDETEEVDSDLSTETLSVAGAEDVKRDERLFHVLGEGLAQVLGQESIMGQEKRATVTYSGDMACARPPRGPWSAAGPVHRHPDALF